MSGPTPNTNKDPASLNNHLHQQSQSFSSTGSFLTPSLSQLINNAANGRFNTALSTSSSPIISAIVTGNNSSASLSNNVLLKQQQHNDVLNFSLPESTKDDLGFPPFNFLAQQQASSLLPTIRDSPLSVATNDTQANTHARSVSPASASTMRAASTSMLLPPVSHQERRASAGPLASIPDTVSQTSYSYSNPFEFLEQHQQQVTAPPPAAPKSPIVAASLKSPVPMDAVARTPSFISAFESPAAQEQQQSPTPSCSSPPSHTPGLISLLTTPLPSRKKSRDQHQKPLVPTTLSGPTKIKSGKGKSKLKQALKSTIEPTRILPSPKQQLDLQAQQKLTVQFPSASSPPKHADLAVIHDSIMHLMPGTAQSTCVYQIPAPTHAPGAILPKYRNNSLFRPLSFLCKSLSQPSLKGSPYLVPDMFLHKKATRALLAQGPDGLLVAFVDSKQTKDTIAFPQSVTWVAEVADLGSGSVFKYSFMLEESLTQGPDYPVCITLSGRYIAVACKSGHIRVLFIDKEALVEYLNIYVTIPDHMAITHMLMIPTSLALVAVVQSPNSTDSGCLLHVKLASGNSIRNASGLNHSVHVSMHDREVSVSLAGMTENGIDLVSDLVPCAVDLYYTLVTEGGTVCIWNGLDLVRMFTLDRVFASLSQNNLINGGHNEILDQVVVGICNPVLTEDQFVFMVATRDGKIVHVSVPRYSHEPRILARVGSVLKLPSGSVVSGIMSDILRTDALGAPNSNSSSVSVWVPFQRPDVVSSKSIPVIAAITLDCKSAFVPSGAAMFLASDSDEVVNSVSMRGNVIIVATDKPMGIHYAKASNLAKIAEWVGASIAFPRVIVPETRNGLAVALCEPMLDSVAVDRELVKVPSGGTLPGPVNVTAFNEEILRTIFQTIDSHMAKMTDQFSKHQVTVNEMLVAAASKPAVRAPSPVRAKPPQMDAKAIGIQVVHEIRGQIHQIVLDHIGHTVRDAATRTITEELVPAYERATREMFCQMADTFQTGIQGVVHQVQHELGSGAPNAVGAKKVVVSSSSADESAAVTCEEEDEEEEEVSLDEVVDEPLTGATVDRLVMQNRFDVLFRRALGSELNAVHTTLDIIAKYSPPKDLAKHITQPVIYGIIVTVSNHITEFANRPVILDERVPWLVACAQAIDATDHAMIQNGYTYLVNSLHSINETEQLLKLALRSGSRSPHLPSFRLLDRLLRGVLAGSGDVVV